MIKLLYLSLLSFCTVVGSASLHRQKHSGRRQAQHSAENMEVVCGVDSLDDIYFNCDKIEKSTAFPQPSNKEVDDDVESNGDLLKSTEAPLAESIQSPDYDTKQSNENGFIERRIEDDLSEYDEMLGKIEDKINEKINTDQKNLTTLKEKKTNKTILSVTEISNVTNESNTANKSSSTKNLSNNTSVTQTNIESNSSKDSSTTKEVKLISFKDGDFVPFPTRQRLSTVSGPTIPNFPTQDGTASTFILWEKGPLDDNDKETTVDTLSTVSTDGSKSTKKIIIILESK